MSIVTLDMGEKTVQLELRNTAKKNTPSRAKLRVFVRKKKTEGKIPKMTLVQPQFLLRRILYTMYRQHR